MLDSTMLDDVASTCWIRLAGPLLVLYHILVCFPKKARELSLSDIFFQRRVHLVSASDHTFVVAFTNEQRDNFPFKALDTFFLDPKDCC